MGSHAAGPRPQETPGKPPGVSSFQSPGKSPHGHGEGQPSLIRRRRPLTHQVECKRHVRRRRSRPDSQLGHDQSGSTGTPCEHTPPGLFGALHRRDWRMRVRSSAPGSRQSAQPGPGTSRRHDNVTEYGLPAQSGYRPGSCKNILALASWCAGFAIKRPCESVLATRRSGSARSRRQASSSPLRRAASSAAKASTPCGDQLIPWCLQRADTAQSLYFSTRVLAIHNPARCRCW